MASNIEKTFEERRRSMLEKQLRGRGIVDPLVLAALGEVPRHHFVPESIREQAYEDRALPIGNDQTISQPYMVAVMTEQLALRETDRVLEVGTGSGYQAAVLSRICREVFTVERIESLYLKSRELFRQMGYRNIRAFLSDGSTGLPSEAPFDAILVTAGAPAVPQPLLDQLGEGGRLVAPVGPRSGQTLVRIIRQEGRFVRFSSTPCVFVPLLGAFGFPAENASETEG